ncbi:MAG: tRNA (adenosine(37)-N6)-threonylcarbamoyltransferase complex ATPase subunit type 1 TsaE [Spirochaetia bacterium]|nr:tRNA (adenosine(37)-N6)-threonylcarbamoyltransferase complex ATPase subunit type 1 TsaE [Spirochaetia bacterium]
MTIISRSVEETQQVGHRLGLLAKAGMVVSLRGSLGSGKTIFAKGFAQALGITEAIVSPTFTIIQEYEGTLPLYHMDLYRISSSEEFEMMGGEEFLHGDGATLIEWSEKISQMLPDSTIYVDIKIMPNQERIITLQGVAL